MGNLVEAGRQTESVSRRDLLRYAGAAALAGIPLFRRFREPQVARAESIYQGFTEFESPANLYRTELPSNREHQEGIQGDGKVIDIITFPTSDLTLYMGPQAYNGSLYTLEDLRDQLLNNLGYQEGIDTPPGTRLVDGNNAYDITVKKDDKETQATIFINGQDQWIIGMDHTPDSPAYLENIGVYEHSVDTFRFSPSQPKGIDERTYDELLQNGWDFYPLNRVPGKTFRRQVWEPRIWLNPDGSQNDRLVSTDLIAPDSAPELSTTIDIFAEPAKQPSDQNDPNRPLWEVAKEHQQTLKEELGEMQLVDITAVDLPDKTNTFALLVSAQLPAGNYPPDIICTRYSLLFNKGDLTYRFDASVPDLKKEDLDYMIEMAGMLQPQQVS